MDNKPPPKRRPKDLAGYLEALSRPVFQAGIGWQAIDAKWDGIRDAFANFDPRAVADFGPREIEQLLGDTRIVRSKAKIEATIDNAQALLELDAEFGGFDRYLRSHGGFEETVADLKAQFRFIGDTGAYHFLYFIDEPVPPPEQWFAATANRRRRRGGSRTPTLQTERGSSQRSSTTPSQPIRPDERESYRLPGAGAPKTAITTTSAPQTVQPLVAGS